MSGWTPDNHENTLNLRKAVFCEVEDSNIARFIEMVASQVLPIFFVAILKPSSSKESQLLVVMQTL